MPVPDRSAKAFQKGVALEASGLTLGLDTRLMRFDATTGQLMIEADRQRCLSLLAAAARSARVAPDTISHVEAAARYWERGDKALANLRLVFAGLPRLTSPADAARLLAAEYLLDQGMTPHELLNEFEIDPTRLGLEKYDPEQPRVPPGQGKESGRWWDGISHWLDEDVPVYDTDTGDEVGTQSRERAILTNPLTIAAAGTAAFFAAEAAAAASAAAAARIAAAELTPKAMEYLTTCGGRLGGFATRQQLYEIAEELWNTGKYFRMLGDGRAAEEYIPGPGGGTRGSTYVDLTAKAANGTTVRVQTIDTLADGVTPTKAEAAAAARIRAAYPNDELRLIPKWPK